jgi:hypothetical protein
MIPVILFTYGLNVNREMLDKMLYVMKRYSSVIIAVNFCSYFVNRYSNIFFPLLWHFFLIPDRINEVVALGTHCINLMLGSSLLEFDQYLAVYISSNFSIALSILKELCPAICISVQHH